MGRHTLPFRLSQARVGRRFFRDNLEDAVGNPVRIDVVRQQDLNLIPEPLARGGKIEVMALDGETVYEGHFAAGRMSRVGPASGLEQDGVQQADPDHLAADAVDFHPVSRVDSVASHEYQPSEKADDQS